MTRADTTRRYRAVLRRRSVGAGDPYWRGRWRDLAGAERQAVRWARSASGGLWAGIESTTGDVAVVWTIAVTNGRDAAGKE
jgi:hypothetical protein